MEAGGGGGNPCKLLKRNGGKTLDAPGCSTQQALPLIQDTDSTNDCQKFKPR